MFPPMTPTTERTRIQNENREMALRTAIRAEVTRNWLLKALSFRQALNSLRSRGEERPAVQQPVARTQC